MRPPVPIGEGQRRGANRCPPVCDTRQSRTVGSPSSPPGQDVVADTSPCRRNRRRGARGCTEQVQHGVGHLDAARRRSSTRHPRRRPPALHSAPPPIRLDPPLPAAVRGRPPPSRAAGCSIAMTRVSAPVSPRGTKPCGRHDRPSAPSIDAMSHRVSGRLVLGDVVRARAAAPGHRGTRRGSARADRIGAGREMERGRTARSRSGSRGWTASTDRSCYPPVTPESTGMRLPAAERRGPLLTAVGVFAEHGFHATP